MYVSRFNNFDTPWRLLIYASVLKRNRSMVSRNEVNAEQAVVTDAAEIAVSGGLSTKPVRSPKTDSVKDSGRVKFGGGCMRF